MTVMWNIGYSFDEERLRGYVLLGVVWGGGLFV